MDQHLFARGRGVLLVFIVTAVASFISPGSCLQQGLLPLNDACTCTGDQLRLTCTVVGEGVTVWGIENCGELLLPSGGFSDPGGVRRERTCSGQTVVARSLSVNGDCFTSELSLMAVSQLDGTNIQCLQNNGTVTSVGNYSIAVVSDPYPTPSDISLTDISSQGLTFGWTTTAPNCSSVSYGVNATGCGNCPVSTNSTSVVCSDVGLSGESRSCDFQVQTITCANLVSSYSNTVTTVLQAPDQPMTTIVPRYQQDSTYLTSFSVTINQVDPVTISGYNITTQSYVLSYRTNNVVCDSRTIEACTEDVCQTEFSLSSSSCSPSSPSGDFSLSVSAASVLGTGPPSTITIARSSADFVRVLPDISDSSISCSFTNSQDTTTKTCSVSYGQCGDLSQTAQANSSSEDVNLVRVQLGVSDSASFCYVVTASNDTYSVQVVGNVGMATTASTSTTKSGGGGTGASSGLQGGAIAAIIIVFILLAVVGGVVAVVIVIFVLRKRTGRRELNNSSEHTDEEKVRDEATSSHSTEEPVVSHELESLPPGENMKEEAATAMETVPNPAYSTTSASISLTMVPLTADNIVHKLSDYASKWYEMGETLSLSEKQLHDINTSGETDEACLRAMVEQYLQLTTVSHTWEEVDAALERAKEAQNQEIEKRLKKHPDQVPVIIERHKGEEILKEKAKTLWIPKKLTIAQLGAAIRKPLHLDLRQEQSLYLNIGGKTITTGTLDDLYNTHKHVDGYLHITFSSQEK